MDLAKAETLARELMTQHGLFGPMRFDVPQVFFGWKFKFDTARKRFGCCFWGTRTISLSRPLTAIGKEEDVRDTILHEIAHALVSPNHGHDRVWRRKALEIGCNGNRCGITKNKLERGGWIGHCPNPEHKHRVFRKPTRTYSCSQCGRDNFRRGYVEAYRIEYRRAPRRTSIASRLTSAFAHETTVP